MSWAKVDDHANEHRKQLAAGAEACWLWTCGLMYANRQTARDGFIPEAAVGMLYPFKSAAYAASLALRLVAVGLWEVADGGYLIHEFTFWNESKERREETLARGRERAAKSYASRRDSSPPLQRREAQTLREGKDVLPNSSGSTPLPALPERDPPPPSVVPPQGVDRDIGQADLDSFAPAPPRAKKPRKAPTTPFPPDLQPLPRQQEKCRELLLNCAEEFEKFSARHQSTGALFADWHRAFDTWIARAPEFRRPVPTAGFRGGRPQEVSPNVDHDTRAALASSRRVQEFLAGAK